MGCLLAMSLGILFFLSMVLLYSGHIWLALGTLFPSALVIIVFIFHKEKQAMESMEKEAMKRRANMH